LSSKRLAALGCRSHSGWAVIVAVAGSFAAPLVLERRRVELLDGSLPVQPYHAAVESGLDLAATAELITRVEELAASRAAAALAEMAGGVDSSRFTVDRVAVVAKDRSLPDDLARILGAHPLLHAAEGDLYEQALAEGAARAGLRVRRVAPTPVSVHPNLDSAARALGPPWQKDHKMAAAAALSVLDAPRR
jgi:hypothetical protein